MCIRDRNTAHPVSGSDPLGLKALNKTLDPNTGKAGAQAAANYNQMLKGKPLHYTGKHLKVSNFLGIRSVTLDMGKDVSLVVYLQPGEKKTLELLKPNDEVEIIGEFDSINRPLVSLGSSWNLKIQSGEIISIRRPKA